MGSRPYLRVVDLGSLRFRSLPPPRDLTGHPPAGAPPQLSAPAPAPALVSAKETTEANHMINTGNADTNPTAIPSVAVAPGNPPPAILPDDYRPATRPEDFLPYFQLPGATRDVTVIVPVAPPHPSSSSQLPPSSATYQQK